jgi:hypothetical protein
MRPRSPLRLVLAVIILAISLAVLAWSFLPGGRVILRQKIQPTEMQLPTPEGYLPLESSLAKQDGSIKATHAVHVVGRFELTT